MYTGCTLHDTIYYEIAENIHMGLKANASYARTKLACNNARIGWLSEAYTFSADLRNMMSNSVIVIGCLQ